MAEFRDESPNRAAMPTNRPPQTKRSKALRYQARCIARNVKLKGASRGKASGYGAGL
jgi:hypothetical protein